MESGFTVSTCSIFVLNYYIPFENPNIMMSIMMSISAVEYIFEYIFWIVNCFVMKLGQLVDVLAGKAFMKYVEWFK